MPTSTPIRTGGRRRLPLRPVSIVVLAAIMAITVVGVVLTGALVHDQEGRLLRERSSEIDAVLSAEIAQINPSLASIGDVLARDPTAMAFGRVGHSEAVAAGLGVGFAWLRPESGGFVILAATGAGLVAGGHVTGALATTLSAALDSPGLHPAPVVTTGSLRAVGFAVGPPLAPAGTVLYRQSFLGPLRPQPPTGAFAGLDVAIYAGSTPSPGQIVTETTASLPLHGQVATARVPAGSGAWLIQIRALTPLVGSIAANARWAAAAAGLLMAALAVSATEIESRRREVAQALYLGEHDLAETLQRSLLPELPVVEGLDVAARYLAGGSGQQVGGDWFDLFPLPNGRTGVVIGDVMGHDLVAAAAMSQVRASLRAFAWQGQEPDRALAQLDHLVDTFALAQLVTLFYGTLGPPAADGSRLLRYANAGHLPPLLRHRDGRVQVLDAASSVLVGADPSAPRELAEVLVAPGTLLVCFTDGLIEVPGGSLDEALSQLALSVAGPAPSAEALCARLVGERRRGPRDDVAVLVVGLRDGTSRSAGVGAARREPVSRTGSSR